MTKEITASCLCGQIKMSCGTQAGSGAYCHCDDCRKSSGSAFAVAVPFEAAGFRITGGEVRSFTKPADNGNTITRHFCLNCGSPLYGTSPDHPDRVYVKAGLLDVQARVQPSHQNWCRSKVAWSEIDRQLPAFPKARS